MAAYNSEKYVGAAIESILKQTYKAYNMKRYIRWYGSFEGLILKYSLDTGQIPVVAAIQLCQKLNKENGN